MPRKKKWTPPTQLEMDQMEGEIMKEMADGTFVTDTTPINIAHEVDVLITNFGIDKAADVAATMGMYDQNDPDRVSDWKDVEQIIRQRQAERAKK